MSRKNRLKEKGTGILNGLNKNEENKQSAEESTSEDTSQDTSENTEQSTSQPTGEDISEVLGEKEKVEKGRYNFSLQVEYSNKLDLIKENSDYNRSEIVEMALDDLFEKLEI